MTVSDRPASWYESSARARIAGLLDAGSFTEFLPPTDRETSPHLPLFDLARAFDDGIVVGRGALDGRQVLVAAQEGRFMGGAFGEVHGAKLVGLLRAAAETGPAAVLILFDTGGVRLQEANAGETAIAEIMRAICDVRLAGVPVVGLVGGRAGAFGGGGLIAGTCSALAVTEQGRIGVSGPEVIETNQGVEEFDSRDRALVWRITGGKHRAIIGGADAYADDTAESLKAAALELIDTAPAFDRNTLRAEHERLRDRLETNAGAADSPEMWRAAGIEDDRDLSALGAEAFQSILNLLGDRHGAR